MHRNHLDDFRCFELHVPSRGPSKLLLAGSMIHDAVSWAQLYSPFVGCEGESRLRIQTCHMPSLEMRPPHKMAECSRSNFGGQKLHNSCSTFHTQATGGRQTAPKSMPTSTMQLMAISVLVSSGSVYATLLYLFARAPIDFPCQGRVRGSCN